ncbi:MAG: decaprenyl-phosphate phosphoribosyltransferase [Candidatus Latescibacteria bacterium]|nr:decaprenyl-phosphate phosphoribosyltransferase [Candidatus Latescibacterota bacterium]
MSALIRAARPKQWTKNSFVLAAVIFAQRIFDPVSVALAVSAAAVFCALSSAVYFVNDIGDREADRLHPVKRLRPIASGEISVGSAVVSAIGLALAGLAAAAALKHAFFVVAVVYLAINAAYSKWLKHMVIVDVLSVASGFVLRVWAGAVVIGVPVTPWILACTLFLALFISLAKRRSEIILLGGDAQGQRRILEEYPTELLDLLIAIVTSLTIMSYSLFTFTAGHKMALIGTVPFVIYGMFRYLYLLYVQKSTDPPDVLILRDWLLLVNMILWVVTAGAILSVAD